MSFTSIWFDKSFLLKLVVAICVVNLTAVLVLAGTGVLKTAQPGDVQYLDKEESPSGPIDAQVSQFVVERPTDVDAFYDAVVRVRSNGPLYNPWGGAHTIQKFHYSPVVYFLFVPFFTLGYFGFKLSWLVFSLLMYATGTYLLLRTVTRKYGLALSHNSILVLSAVSLGFGPAVTNFKTGQTGVLLYLAVAMSWSFYRRNEDAKGGGSLVLATLIKPYMTTPLVLFADRKRYHGLIGFAAVFLVANIIGVIFFSLETLYRYYLILFEFGISDTTAAPGRLTGFGDWFASSLRPFAGFGPLAFLLRLAVLISFAYVSLRHALDREKHPPELFTISLVSVMFFIQGASVTDAAALLAAFIVLGARLYPHTKAFASIVLAFLLFQSHFYVMELLVGWGAQNIQVIGANERLVVTLVPFLQPGVYGLLILLALGLFSRRLPIHGSRSSYRPPESKHLGRSGGSQ